MSAFMGMDLKSAILESAATRSGSGQYIHRVSGVSRCPRDAAMHANGVEKTDPTPSFHGTQLRFDIGHDVEARVLKEMENSGLGVGFNQLRVVAQTPMGLSIPGHIDGIVVVPEGMGGGGFWYLFDVKSAGSYAYSHRFDNDPPQAKREHMEQVAIYADAVVDDSAHPEICGVRLRDLEFDGLPCGGGVIIYVAIDNASKGYGQNRVHLPRVQDCPFDLDEVDVVVLLDEFDEIERHRVSGTIPPKPDNSDHRLWSSENKKTGEWTPARCSARWCQRFTACQER